MQQEESREAVVADEPEFLIQACEGLMPPALIGVPPPRLVGADARQGGIGVLPGVPGCEVREPVSQIPREVELQPLREAQGLRHGVRVVAKPRSHLGGRAQHRLPVAAPHLLRCVEGEAVPHGHQDVLQECPAG